MTTAVRRDVAGGLRRARPLIAIALLVVLGAVLTVAFTEQTNRATLDPASVDEMGSRALAQLLRAQGVDVTVGRYAEDVADAGTDATVLVPFPSALAQPQIDELRDGGADVVLVAPRQSVLDELAPGVEAVRDSAPVDPLDPGCSQPDAQAAGRISAGGSGYTEPNGAIACYPLAGQEASLVQASLMVALVQGGRTLTIVGSADVFTNRYLADEGNAALTMRLLGRHRQLVWFQAADEGAPVEQQRGILELLPDGVVWATVTLVVAALVAMVWRARRLGPVVTEQLPVAVRAAEAVEGRALLYRRARDRGHATATLRRATRARLAGLLGLPTGTDGPELVAAVAAGTRRPPAEVDALLYGPAPADDTAMVAEVAALDAIEKEVRRA